jgi:hypothetical protein
MAKNGRRGKPGKARAMSGPKESLNRKFWLLAEHPIFLGGLAVVVTVIALSSAIAILLMIAGALFLAAVLRVRLFEHKPRAVQLIGNSLTILVISVALFGLWSFSQPRKVEHQIPPVKAIEVFGPFRTAHKEFEEELGDARDEQRETGDSVIYAFEHAEVFWSLTLGGFYKLPIDGRKWDFEREPFFNDKSPWNSRSYVIKKLNLPPGQNPPLFGAASHWADAPEKWQWVGGLLWLSAFWAGTDTIFYQRFERGWVIGPLLVSTKQKIARVAVLLDDGRWYPRGLTGFDSLIPPYKEPAIDP